MNLISVPPESTKHKDLVAIPRGLYREFQRWQKSRTVRTKSTTKWAEVAQAAADAEHGKHIAFTAKKPGDSRKFLTSLMRRK